MRACGGRYGGRAGPSGGPPFSYRPSMCGAGHRRPPAFGGGNLSTTCCRGLTQSLQRGLPLLAGAISIRTAIRTTAAQLQRGLPLLAGATTRACARCLSACCFNGASRFWRGQCTTHDVWQTSRHASTGPPAFGGGNGAILGVRTNRIVSFNGASRFWRGQYASCNMVWVVHMLQRGLPLLAGAIRLLQHGLGRPYASTGPPAFGGGNLPLGWRHVTFGQLQRGLPLLAGAIYAPSSASAPPSCFNGASRFWRGQSGGVIMVCKYALLQRGLPLLAGAIFDPNKPNRVC